MRWPPSAKLQHRLTSLLQYSTRTVIRESYKFDLYKIKSTLTHTWHSFILFITLHEVMKSIIDENSMVFHTSSRNSIKRDQTWLDYVSGDVFLCFLETPRSCEETAGCWTKKGDLCLKKIYRFATRKWCTVNCDASKTLLKNSWQNLMRISSGTVTSMLGPGTFTNLLLHSD